MADDPEIHTDRLVLRRYRDEDAEPMNAAVRDPRVHRNVGKIPPDQTLDDTRAFIARARDRWDAGEAYGFAILADGALVGVTGGGTSGVHGPLDVGYWIAPDRWGRGYATEAFTAFRDWLAREKGLRALTAGHFLDNPASGRVLRKVDFIPAGRSTYHCLGRNALVECLDMAWIAPSA